MASSKRDFWIVMSGALALGCMACWIAFTWQPPDGRDPVYGDEESLFEVLSRVEPGTSVEQLVREVGPPEVLAESQRQKHLQVLQTMANQTPEAFPDGVADEDTLVSYRAGQSGTILQTRDGRLVNFRPSDYSRAEPVRILR